MNGLPCFDCEQAECVCTRTEPAQLRTKLDLLGFNGITDGQRAIIKAAIEEGQPLSVGARRAQVSESLLRNVVSWGRDDPDGPAGPFVRDIDKLRAEHEAKSISKMRDIALSTKDSKHILKYLETLNPEEYGPPSSVQVNDINVDIGFMEWQESIRSSGPGD